MLSYTLLQKSCHKVNSDDDDDDDAKLRFALLV